MADLTGLAQATALQGLLPTGILCAVVLSWVVVWFFVARWAHGDAPGHGMPAIPWFLIVFLLGLVGLLLYLVVRGLRGPRGDRRREGVEGA
ncbi:MAG TPA: hypothetical protein VGR51_05765 [Thermoplasmata archaeon]|nr:hypothetical protein [Thermoplasmata archaeon]